MTTKNDIRSLLLNLVATKSANGQNSNLQSSSILQEAGQVFGHSRSRDIDLAILTQWSDFFRTGYLAWGHDLMNPGPPFFHITEQGRKSLAQLSRDPANPAGYLKHLSSLETLSEVTQSYLDEALKCYVNDLPKAAAVMIGAAAESMLFELRDLVVNRIKQQGQSPSKSMQDWRIKTITDALKVYFDNQKPNIPSGLYQKYEGYWPAFTLQIRAVRNDAGHPVNINLVTHETVHAAFLTFPELAKLIVELETWLKN